ncbi:MAG: heavy-metal-associated domain-containing protein [Candidatus Anstonellaceae archaeon]
MKQTFSVKGMHCPSCEKLLQMDIGELKGVAKVAANHKTGIVEVDGTGYDASAVKKAIEQNGYKVL